MTWWTEFLTEMDSCDVGRAGAWFSDDVVLRIDDHSALVGKASAIAALTHAFDNIQTMRHDIGTVVRNECEAFLECEVSFVFKDGSDFATSAAAYMRVAPTGKIAALHVYNARKSNVM